MKNILNVILLTLGIVCFYSCETDNYDGPNAQITGQVFDHNGLLLRTEPGASNMRIQMDELSWANGDTSIAILPSYLNMRMDGTYTNTKIFSGTYRMTPIEGPFYPYGDGDTVVIGSSAVKNFTVTPYLDVNWEVEPYITADSLLECSIKFTRNAKAGEFMPDVLNARLCISSNRYVGNNNHYGDIIAGAVTVTNAQEETAITLSTTQPLKYYNTDIYVRVGVCCNDNYKKYNYTTVVKLHVPSL